MRHTWERLHSLPESKCRGVVFRLARLLNGRSARGIYRKAYIYLMKATLVGCIGELLKSEIGRSVTFLSNTLEKEVMT